MGLCSALAVAQVPPTPVIRPVTRTRSVIGPVVNLSASSFGPLPDGGGVIAQQWSLSPTRDGGTYLTRQSNAFNSFDLGAEEAALRAALAPCSTVTLQVRNFSDAGPSPWSDAGPPMVWDHDPPSSLSALSLSTTSTLGSFALLYGASVDTCTPVDQIQVYFDRALGLSAPARWSSATFAPDAGFATLVMGEGDWKVGARALDSASNSGPIDFVSDALHVTSTAAHGTVPDITFLEGSYVADNGSPFSWTLVPDASAYVMFMVNDAGQFGFFRTATAPPVGATPIGNDIPHRVWIAVVASDGGVGPWAVSSQTITVDRVAPTQPGVPTASWDGGLLVELSWAPAVDGLSPSVRTVIEQTSTLGNWVDAGLSFSNQLSLPALSGEWRYRAQAFDLAGNPSPRSGPSALLFVDVDPPAPPGAQVPRQTVVRDGGVELTWARALDAPDASAPVTYELWRAAQGAAPTTLVTQTSATSAVAAVPPSQWEFFVIAVDAFGRRSARAGPSATVESVEPMVDSPDASVLDAGNQLDAGPQPDAGTQLDAGSQVDAGQADDGGASSDAGPEPVPRTLQLGCSCDAGASALSWVLLVLARRRR